VWWYTSYLKIGIGDEVGKLVRAGNKFKRYFMKNIDRLTWLILYILLISILYAICTLPASTKEPKYFLMTATGYYPGPECTYPSDDGFTAIGDIAGRGCIAIDDRNGPLKMGQRIWVENYGYGKCNDRGLAIKNWKIDLCFETYEEAIEWGRKLIKVYVLEEN
jgi:3D (Asp-Asp-Asp) domain-containing protein